MGAGVTTDDDLGHSLRGLERALFLWQRGEVAHVQPELVLMKDTLVLAGRAHRDVELLYAGGDIWIGGSALTPVLGPRPRHAASATTRTAVRRVMLRSAVNCVGMHAEPPIAPAPLREPDNQVDLIKT